MFRSICSSQEVIGINQTQKTKQKKKKTEKKDKQKKTFFNKIEATNTRKVNTHFYEQSNYHNVFYYYYYYNS